MEKVDLFNLPYYFRVKALQGNDCAKRDLCFSPQLLSNGVEVSSNSTITWYEQDLIVDVASDNYDRAAGVGWKKGLAVESSTINKTEPCIYNNSLYVPQNSIPQIKRFKVIATYDKSTFDKVIEVVNSAITNPYSLVYENDKLKVQNATGKSITWYYAVGTSTFAKIDDNKTDTLSLINYAKYINVKFYCVVDDDTILEYDYTNEIVEEITVTYDGTSMFKYDASGKIDDTIYSSEYALTAKVAFQNGLSDKQYEIKWYTPDGNELVVADQKHEIKNSMVTQVRLDTKNSIRYNISSYYKQDSNNTFKIKIITADKEYSFEKEITFIKDGDQGTNGSACALVIKPVNGKKDYIYYKDKDNNDIAIFEVFLYNIKNNTSENVTEKLKVEGYNVNCILDKKNKLLQVKYNKSTDSDVKDYYYIKLTYAVEAGPDIVLCYPIDIVKEDKKPTLDIAKYIKYDALGMNPICRKEILGYTGESFTVIDNSQALIVNKGYLSPNSHFPFDGTEGFLALKYDKGNVIHTIYFYKNSYGNTAINNWDGQKVSIAEGGDYILAPLIGAGTKSNSNFTGVVMGYDSSQGMGLYGYKDGIASFGFKTDGTGYIGAEASGRISFNGKNAVIYGGLSQNGNNSMTLNLYNDTDEKNKTNENTLAIDIKDSDGSSTFSVNYGGKLKSTSGTIGGWIIDSTTLKGGSTILSSSGTITTNNLIANIGCKIGSWLIDDNGLRPERYNDKDFSSMTSQVSGKYKIFIDNIIFAYKTENDSYNLGSYIGYRQNKSVLDICGGPLSTVQIYGESEGAHLSFKGEKMECTYSAENQHGIYARFAD